MLNKGETLLNIDEKLFKNPEQEYGDNYRTHYLEIYKLYLDMMDKIGARRQTANSFFLTINSAIIALLGYELFGNASGAILTLKTLPSYEFYWIISLLGMVICVAWFKVLHLYRNLLRAKFNVIQRIEQKLPLAPYEAEWEALGGDKLYQPLTHSEMLVPWVFFILNIAISLKATLA